VVYIASRWLNLPSDDHQVVLHLPMNSTHSLDLLIQSCIRQWHVMFLQEFFFFGYTSTVCVVIVVSCIQPFFKKLVYNFAKKENFKIQIQKLKIKRVWSFPITQK
jgi:hypothetical protein